ncbi:MAG: hypothetical protein KGJ86_04965 [Chloroflexota bacterium]|nr:hypothetical protein [Chloroflexota bacterium]
MTTDDLAYSTIWQTAPKLRSGEVSSRQLTEACLDRVNRFNSRINAFITLLGESALAQAEEADREIEAGRYRGPLHGIPLVHKDLYYTRGIRTTAGSKILGDFVPEEDAAAVAKLKDAGTVLLAKASMQEFALGGSNNNPHYGAVHNPWDLSCVPGGSSGGSAAALAAGFCLAATGTDTAASIRHPAHMCGVSGIKPTYGRVSCYGVVPLSWSLDHPGPLARSVRDCALLLQAMAGYDPRDAASVDRPVPDFSADLDKGVSGLRIGVPRNYFTEQVQEDVLTAYHAAVEKLKQLGAQLVEVEFEALAAMTRRLNVEAAAYHEQWLRERPQDYGADIRPALENGLAAGGVEHIKGERRRAAVLVEMRQVFEKVDLLATPTVPVTASPIGQNDVDINGELHPVINHWIRFTSPFNQTGFPASSQPCGFDRKGLPLGLQLAGRPWEEATVLRAGATYERATDWHLRRASLA